MTASRWEHYVLLRGEEVRTFWRERLAEQERSLLFVLGRGFDPRMVLGIQALLESRGVGRRHVVGLDFEEGPTSPSLTHADLVAQNWAALEATVGGRGTIETRSVVFWSPEGRRVSSQSARDLFSSVDALLAYTDVVVDISAMPRSVYFPLIARLLYLADDHLGKGGTRVDLHVVVAEDAALDARISELGVDEKAEFMASFGGGFDEEGTQTPKIWIPMLGETRGTQFDRIYDRVKPDEVCPVLPSPSRNPRRADDIVIEYQRALFDQLHLDPRNFLYVSEQNPFEVYRQLRAAVLRYRDVFRLLGGCRVALSPLSSKLMSLGALLVAYELKGAGYGIGVAHVESQGYALEGAESSSELYGLWLTGDC